MNIDNLKKIIQEANPEILELKFGCEVKRNNGRMGVVIEMRSLLGVVHWKRNKVAKLEIAEAYEILGRPIGLADVLYTLMNYAPKKGRKLPYREDMHEILENLILFKWNMLDDDLDHQNNHCKQFLIDLLCPL